MYLAEKSKSSSGSNEISSSLEGCSDNSVKGVDVFNVRPLSRSEWGLPIIILKDELILWRLHPWTLFSRSGTPLLSSWVIPVTSTLLKRRKNFLCQTSCVNVEYRKNMYVWEMTMGWKSVTSYFQLLSFLHILQSPV